MHFSESLYILMISIFFFLPSLQMNGNIHGLYATGLYWKPHLPLSDNKSRSRWSGLSSEVRFDTVCRLFVAVFKSSINSQQNTLYFLQKLALKRHKMSKEKLQYCKTSSSSSYMPDTILNVRDVETGAAFLSLHSVKFHINSRRYKCFSNNYSQSCLNQT